jgi:nucleotide-binding universal stress UspA family protein
MPMSEPIVVGYDGTEGAKAALAEAVRLAGALDAELILAFASHTNPAGGEVADAAAALHERGEAVLEEALEQARAAGVSARAEIVHGRPYEALAALAEGEGAQLIAVGSYGERPLRALIVGSTPPRLMHVTHVPVLVVRGAEAPAP